MLKIRRSYIEVQVHSRRLAPLSPVLITVISPRFIRVRYTIHSQWHISNYVSLVYSCAETEARSVFAAPEGEPEWLAEGGARRQSWGLARGGSKHRPGWGLGTGISFFFYRLSASECRFSIPSLAGRAGMEIPSLADRAGMEKPPLADRAGMDYWSYTVTGPWILSLTLLNLYNVSMVMRQSV